MRSPSYVNIPRQDRQLPHRNPPSPTSTYMVCSVHRLLKLVITIYPTNLIQPLLITSIPSTNCYKSSINVFIFFIQIRWLRSVSIHVNLLCLSTCSGVIKSIHNRPPSHLVNHSQLPCGPLRLSACRHGHKFDHKLQFYQ